MLCPWGGHVDRLDRSRVRFGVVALHGRWKPIALRRDRSDDDCDEALAKLDDGLLAGVSDRRGEMLEGFEGSGA